MQRNLPWDRIWLPCNYNAPMMYWIISIHQIVSLIFATMINVGMETLVFGLFIQTCVQLEIFKSLQKLIINKTVRYLGHFSIYKSHKNLFLCIYLHISFCMFEISTMQILSLNVYRLWYMDDRLNDHQMMPIFYIYLYCITLGVLLMFDELNSWISYYCR